MYNLNSTAIFCSKGNLWLTLRDVRSGLHKISMIIGSISILYRKYLIVTELLTTKIGS